MKVLFLQHGLGYGGATKSLLVMQQALGNKVEMHMVLKRNKRLNKVLSKQFIHSKSITEIDIPGVYSYSEGTISFTEFENNITYYPTKIIEFIKREKIDIFHINTSVFSNILRDIKEKTTCKIIVHFREMLPFGPSHKIDEYIIKNTLKYADKIIAISPNELRFFPESNKTSILSNPHDFNLTDLILKKTRKKSKSIKIGMCANFVLIKGHLVFIEAIKRINDILINKNIEVEFCIIGYPHRDTSIKGILKWIFNRSYKKKVDTLILKNSIKNLQLVPFTFNVLEEVSLLDVYVRPDLSGNPWGRDIIEAMALKKPVIATGSSTFYVKDRVNGFLIEAGNIEQLVSKITTLIFDEQLRSEMGHNGYKMIKEFCDMERYGDKLLKIYFN